MGFDSFRLTNNQAGSLPTNGGSGKAGSAGQSDVSGYDTRTFCLPVFDPGEANAADAVGALEKLGKVLGHSSVIEDAASRTDRSPTQSQRDAGNYRKGVFALHGLTVVIENPKGSTRSGTRKNGSKWQTTMRAHYGYVRNTRGRDGDPVDVFIGEEPESEIVFVINQLDPDTGKFDEHKAVLGTTNEAAARELYLANYEKGWKGLGSVKAMTIPQFTKWLDGDLTKRAADTSASPDISGNVDSR